MKLLVAQMKYQDPLEPTSNTEYIQQYSTFSELEQMQNMSQNMSLSRASDMVGKTVIVNTTNADGTTSQVEGKVDYVTYSSGAAYVNINGNSYSADNVSAVVDSTYKTQTDAAQAVMDEIDKLGSLQEITLSDATSINNIEKVYEGLDSTTKSYIKSNYVTALEQYVARIKELQSEKSSSDSTAASDSSTSSATETSAT
jgi:flagellar basal-body rod modification protein FlgD